MTTILTPYFLDQRINLDVATDEINSPTMPIDTPVRQRLIALYRPLADMVETVLRQGQRPVSIAGDCVASLAVLAGLQRADISPTVIWFDAHGDFNTSETTPSGFLGGMPLAMAVGRGDLFLVRALQLRPLPEEQVILSDARDLDPGEREALAESGVLHVPHVQQLLQQPLPDGPLHVHFDCDVLDPTAVPAVQYPAPDGPSPQHLRPVFRRLRQSGQIAAVSVSTWTPDLDRDGQSERVVLDLLDELT